MNAKLKQSIPYLVLFVIVSIIFIVNYNFVDKTQPTIETTPQVDSVKPEVDLKTPIESVTEAEPVLVPKKVRVTKAKPTMVGAINRRVTDKNLTHMNDIQGGWSVGDKCGVGETMNGYIDGDWVLTGNTTVRNATMKVFGRLIDNGYTLTMECPNSSVWYSTDKN